MPTFDPTEIYTVTLKSHSELGKKCKFFTYYPTGREHRQIEKVINCENAIEQGELTQEQYVDNLFSEVAKILTGWSGITNREGKLIAYSKEVIEDAISVPMAVEFLINVAQGNVTQEDKKKSESVSLIDTESSANNALEQKNVTESSQNMNATQ